MPRFKVEDRVIHRDRPDGRGTIVRVIKDAPDDAPGSTRYEIRWDEKARGTFAEEALEPVPIEPSG
jgi:hypothetical protein